MANGENAQKVQNGVQVAAGLAQAVAPIVSIYNPAVGAALAAFAPVVSEFILTETQVIMNLQKDMTKDEMVAALQQMKGSLQALPPLETPEE